MTLPSSLIDLAGWIEAHATTVGLLKWVIVGLLAWALGVFRFLRAKLKRPKLEIESFTSRCIWQELGVVDGNDHNARVVFLVEGGINNPTTDPIFVRDFTLKLGSASLSESVFPPVYISVAAVSLKNKDN